MLRVIIFLSIVMRTIDIEISALKFDGDFSIGVLFNIREEPARTEPFCECGSIQPHSIQEFEAALFALRMINSDEKILPNVTLGMDIRDTCKSETLALSEALSLTSDTTYAKLSEDSEQKSEKKSKKYSPSSTSQASLRKSPIIGIIGPSSTEETMQVQSLLKLFNIPQIGYSDMSKILNDKIKYPTFMRIVPCESLQTTVIFDILQKFNWTYVSVVRNADLMNHGLSEYFRSLVHQSYNDTRICIASEVTIESHYDTVQIDSVIQKLDEDKSVNVVICFCKDVELRLLLQATKRLNLINRFNFIIGDIWENGYEISRDLQEQAWGLIHIQIQSSNIPNFSNYYKSLKPSNNSYNVWFEEFWEDKFNCILPSMMQDPDLLQIYEMYSPIRSCTGNESLAENYSEHRLNGFVMKAVWAMAHGLHNMMTQICGANYSGPCMKMYPFNISMFMGHVMNLSFVFDDELVKIDMGQNPIPRYNILNFQKFPNNTFDFAKIAQWSNGSLEILDDYQSKEYKLITSICSAPCPLGYRKVFSPDNVNPYCCWDCESCNDYDYVSLNKERCLPCSLGERPNANRTACDEIPISGLDWSDPLIVVITFFAITGLTFTIITFYIFIKYKDTPVVKASSGQICYLILCSMILAHITVFIILANPTACTCALSRTLPGIAMTMMSAGLFTKTSRIARILARSKKSFPRKKYRLMTTSSQIAIIFFCVAIETAICCTMLIINSPVPCLIYPTRAQVSLVCISTPMDVILPCVLIMFLHGLCILYGIKTRNVPGNFNESQFIAFTMLLYCIMWIVFFSIFFRTSFQGVTITISLTLNASLTLIFLFFPKLYIIIFKPEKNNRALFITNKYIRTHIGSSVKETAFTPVERSIDILSETNDETSGHSCRLRRTVAIQTSSKLLRNVETLYDEYVTPSMEQDYSSSDDDYYESVTNNGDNVNAQHNNVNVSNQYNKNIVTKFNNIENNKRGTNWSSRNIRRSLGKIFSMTTVTREANSKKQSPAITSLEPWVELNVDQLPQTEITRPSISSEQINLQLATRKNVPKEEIKTVIEQEKRTRIYEEPTHTLNNGDPIFNITITLGSESSEVLVL